MLQRHPTLGVVDWRLVIVGFSGGRFNTKGVTMITRVRKTMTACLLCISLIMLAFNLPQAVAVVSANSYICLCGGQVFAYEYPETGGWGSGWYGEDRGHVADNVACASNCQNWMIERGAIMCSEHNLNGGVGYVRLNWEWQLWEEMGSYAELRDSGYIPSQQYDCDDIS